MWKSISIPQSTIFFAKIPLLKNTATPNPPLPSPLKVSTGASKCPRLSVTGWLLSSAKYKEQTHSNTLKLRNTIYLFSLAYGKGDFNKKLNEIDTIPKITVCAFQTKLLQYKICDLDSLASSKNAARRSNVASVFLKRFLYSLEIITNFCWENLTFFPAATGALLAVYHSGTRWS